jgi:hypothetical protein
MSSDNKDILNAVFFFGAGIWAFFWGFMRLRRKRLIENIPTSSVRGLALGLVELIGKTEKTKSLTTPFTGTACVFYQYTVERYEKRGKSSSWVTIAKGNSFYCPFWLDDGTGKILIFPQQAELFLPLDYEFKTGFGSPLPLNLVEFMEKQGLRYQSIFGNHTLRFRELYIQPGQTVYVLGTAKKNQDYLSNHNEIVAQRLEELKNNTAKMPEIDLNKDGEISIEEWNRAVAKVEQGTLEEELKIGQTKEAIDVIISQGDCEKVFIISDQAQKEILAKLSWQALLGIWGGAIVAIVMFWYLLFRCGFF